ncbi:MAG TPA: biopolymer transporter ExbD [Gemmatimonadaceae bacterium]|nr:biopolymer transporter ExbD [Gemmatimonadaceae bacterium]
MSRARENRAARRAAQFAKFRITELNLIPLVDTFVSIVFFALTTQTVGELTQVVSGVNLPESQVGVTAHKQLTLGIGGQITLSDVPLMSTVDAARAQSNDPTQPLLIPRLYNRLRQVADSIRREEKLSADQSVPTPLAVQGDKTMRYALLARVMQTARLAGFKSISLQVHKTEAPQATQAAR